MRRNFAIYLTIIGGCMFMGLLALLVGPQTSFIQKLNTVAFDQLTSNSSPTDQKYDGFTRQRDSVTERKASPEKLPLSIVEIDLNNSDVFASTPPSASDTAVIINTLKKAGAKNILFSTQLKWDQTDDFDYILSTSMKSQNSSSLARVTIPLILSRSANNSSLPSYLKSSSIPLQLIDGDTSNIPKVNRIINNPVDGILFNSENEVPLTCRFGFAKLDSETDSLQHEFLLSKWNDHILLNSSLLNVLTLMEIPISDITIEMGQRINLGPNRPSIKIDEYGRTQIPSEGHAPTPLIAHELLEVGKLKDLQPNILITAKPSSEYSTQLIKTPYLQLLGFSQLSVFEKQASYLRLPLWLEAFILIELAIICVYLYRFTGVSFHLAFLALNISTWLTTLLLFKSAQYWLPIAPLLFVTISGWLLCIALRSKWTLRRSNSRISKSAKKALARFD